MRSWGWLEAGEGCKKKFDGKRSRVRFVNQNECWRAHLRDTFETYLHVSRVNAKDLEATVLVGAPDVDFTVETPEATQRRINRVGAVGRTDDDDIGALFEAVH